MANGRLLLKELFDHLTGDLEIFLQEEGYSEDDVETMKKSVNQPSARELVLQELRKDCENWGEDDRETEVAQLQRLIKHLEEGGDIKFVLDYLKSDEAGSLFYTFNDYEERDNMFTLVDMMKYACRAMGEEV